MYKAKLEVMNMISRRKNDENRNYELLDDQSELLRDLNTYFPKLMTYLWEQPETVATIIKNANSEELKELAPLFANNFYDNILSPYYIEDNLMYVLALLLKDEIKNLSNINQDESFLNNTPCGSILGELKSKNDIRAFFKTIIISSIENLEVNYSTVRINFSINALVSEYNKLTRNDSKVKKKMKRDEGYLKYPDNDIDQCSDSISLDDNRHMLRDKKKIKEDQENFNQKYLPFLDKNNFLREIEKYKNNNKNMYDYCYSKLNDCNSDPDLYSNKKLMDSLYECPYSQELLLKYQHYFALVTSFINSIISNLLENYHLLPYSVKCLCKIISLLISKKFTKINEVEKNAFIAKFFFGKLLLPILDNPAIEAFINNFIISKNTYKNLKKITEIIGKFVSGRFFESNNENSHYTPYNWYFMEKMEDLLKIFNNITKVKLPPFIEKLINDELPSDYQYNYFIENPDEVINHRSICYNTSQIKAIINSMDRSKNEIFADSKNIGLKKTLEKIFLPNNITIIENIIKEENIISQPKKAKPKSKKSSKDLLMLEFKKPVVHYFLLASLLTNKKYDSLMHINQETTSFSIKELKPDNDENIMKNNIIKVKNFFCSLLYNYNKLVKTDFDEGTTEDTVKILNELNIFMKSSNFVVDRSIPFEWYSKSLLEYLQKIPENLTKNDCEELYNEIEKDLNESVKQLDFEALSVIIGKLKYAERSKIHYEDCKKVLNDIRLNEETKQIVENEFIPFEIKFNFEDEYNVENNIFEINYSNFKERDKDNIDKIKDYERAKKVRLCLTINDFTKKFPNLVIYQEMQDADVFNIQRSLNIPDKIKFYFHRVKQTIDKKKVEYSINEKIYDYVMGKLYDKIYPIEPFSEDNKIFQQSIRLSWTEPKHFIRLKRSLIFGSFLSDALIYFKLVDTEKSPRKKLLNLVEIFNLIGFLLKFNGFTSIGGVDDQLPILNYAFVQSKSLRMFSNAKYMELYLGDKKNKIEGSLLTQLLGICEMITHIKYNQLINVTEEEFNEKCKEATNSQK